MAASREFAELVIGCEGRDNIGRVKRELAAVSPLKYYTRGDLLCAVFFTGSAEVSPMLGTVGS
jgi:hypothetical protein